MGLSDIPFPSFIIADQRNQIFAEFVFDNNNDNENICCFLLPRFDAKLLNAFDAKFIAHPSASQNNST